MSRYIMNIISFHFPSNPNKATNLYKVTSEVFFESMRNILGLREDSGKIDHSLSVNRSVHCLLVCNFYV